MKKALFVATFVFSFMIPAFSGTLTLIAPDGGELCLGRSSDISWTATGIRADVKVKLILYKDSVRLGAIALDLDAGASPYHWTVGRYAGGTADPGRGYRIRLRTMDNTVEDFDNAPFSIVECPLLTVSPVRRTLSTRPFTGSGTTVRVTGPNGGERITIGETTAITWEHAHARPGQRLNVYLIYYLFGCRDETSKKIIPMGSLPVETGHFNWDISPVFKPSSRCVIRIEPAIAGDFAPDESDDCFEIRRPNTTVHVLSPNGIESFERGAPITVRWEMTNPKSWQQFHINLQHFDSGCSHSDYSYELSSCFPIDRREMRVDGFYTREAGFWKISISVFPDIPTGDPADLYLIAVDHSDSCFTIR